MKKLVDQLTSTKIRLLAFSVILFLLASAKVLAGQSLPSGISVSASVSKYNFGVSDSILVDVEYLNISNQTIRFLKWSTALEGIVTDDIFVLNYNGRELNYQGPHIKRMPPSASDYVSLDPGQSISATVDIAKAYPINYKGEYQLRMRDMDVGVANGLTAKQSSKEVLTIRLDGDRPIQAFKRQPQFQSCSVSQQSQINDALTAAERISRTAIADIRNAPVSLRSSARRYREWFGSYNVSRYATVERNMSRIADALSNRVIGFDCDCSSHPNPNSIFAFVFPNDPYNMTLCGAFWRARLVGTDSKSGTIVHEVSHFNVVAATDDFRNSQAGIRDLANTQPNNAVRAANAYEYFAENTPFLPMPRPQDVEPDPVPDLLVSSISVSSQSVRVKDSISILGSVQNIGDAASSATQLSFKISNDARITTSDLQIAQSSVSVIPDGASFNVQVDATVPDEEGQYWIGACVAPVSGEVETNNNCSVGVPVLVERRIVITPILFLLLSNDD